MKKEKRWWKIHWSGVFMAFLFMGTIGAGMVGAGFDSLTETVGQKAAIVIAGAFILLFALAGGGTVYSINASGPSYWDSREREEKRLKMMKDMDGDDGRFFKK